jgi:hypothetical protein
MVKPGNVHGRWDEAKDDQRCIAWAREFFNASRPYASGGAYVNFMTEEEGDRIDAAYAGNYSRMVEIKRRLGFILFYMTIAYGHKRDQ